MYGIYYFQMVPLQRLERVQVALRMVDNLEFSVKVLLTWSRAGRAPRDSTRSLHCTLSPATLPKAQAAYSQSYSPLFETTNRKRIRLLVRERPRWATWAGWWRWERHQLRSHISCARRCPRRCSSRPKQLQIAEAVTYNVEERHFIDRSSMIRCSN